MQARLNADARVRRGCGYPRQQRASQRRRELRDDAEDQEMNQAGPEREGSNGTRDVQSVDANGVKSESSAQIHISAGSLLG